MRSKTFVHDLSKKYVQGKTLGEGSFGRVVKCINVQTNTQVAMKIVNKKKILKNPALALLMEQELEILRKTNHPHIVRHLDLVEDDVNFYIVSEIIDGGELYDYILKVKRLSER